MGQEEAKPLNQKYSPEEVKGALFGLVEENLRTLHEDTPGRIDEIKQHDPEVFIGDILASEGSAFRGIPLSQLNDVAEKLGRSPLYKTKDGCHLVHYLVGRMQVLADLRGVGGLLEEIRRTGLLDARQEPECPKRQAQSHEEATYRNSPQEVQKVLLAIIKPNLEVPTSVSRFPEALIQCIGELRACAFKNIPLSQLDTIADTLKNSRLYDTEDGRCLWYYLIGKIQVLEEVGQTPLKQLVRMID
jgi:hypothetical protein